MKHQIRGHSDLVGHSDLGDHSDLEKIVDFTGASCEQSLIKDFI